MSTRTNNTRRNSPTSPHMKPVISTRLISNTTPPPYLLHPSINNLHGIQYDHTNDAPIDCAFSIFSTLLSNKFHIPSESIIPHELNRMDPAQYHKSLIKMLGLMNAEIDLDGTLECLMEAARKLVSVEAITIFVISQERNVLVCKSADLMLKDAIGMYFNVGEGVVGQTAETGKVIVVADTLTDPRFNPSIDVFVPEVPVHSLLSVPIIDVYGYVRAVLVCVNKREVQTEDPAQNKSSPVSNHESALHAVSNNQKTPTKSSPTFTVRDQENILALASASGHIFRKAQLSQQLHNEKTKTRALVEVLQADEQEEHIDGYISRILKIAHDIVPCERVSIFFVDAVREDFYCASLSYDTMEQGIPPDYFSVQRTGIPAWVIKHNSVLNLSNVPVDPRYTSTFDDILRFTTLTCLAVPLINSNGTSMAILVASNKIRSDGSVVVAFDNDDEEVLGAWSIQVASAMRRRQGEVLIDRGRRELNDDSQIHSLLQMLGNDHSSILHDEHIPSDHIITPSSKDSNNNPANVNRLRMKSLAESKWQRISQPPSPSDLANVSQVWRSAPPPLLFQSSMGSSFRTAVSPPTTAFNANKCHSTNPNGSNTASSISPSSSPSLSPALTRRFIPYTSQPKSASPRPNVSTLDLTSQKLRRTQSISSMPYNEMQLLREMDAHCHRSYASVASTVTSPSLVTTPSSSIPSSASSTPDVLRPLQPGRLVSRPPSNSAETTHRRFLSSPWPCVSPSSLAPVETLASLTFNCFDYTEDQLLFYCVLMLEDLDLITPLQIHLSKLQTFLLVIRSKYRDNPYHNFYHGFSVMQFGYLMVRKTRAKDELSPIDHLALLISCLCHDVDHPGTTNGFQICTDSVLSRVHNQTAVLENHHAFVSCEILRDPGTNFLPFLNSAEMRQFRQTVIASILATDMTVHFDLCKKFATLESNLARYSRSKVDDRQLLINMIVHSSDLSGQVMDMSIASLWEQRVATEFIAQAIMEDELGLPVSEFMKGLHDTIVRFQNHLNFLDFVVAPLWTIISQVLEPMNICVEQLQVNRKVYAEKLLAASSTSSQPSGEAIQSKTIAS